MGIKLSIEIESPLTPDDKDLLSGVAVMVLAVANRQLAAQGFPAVFPPDEEKAEEPTEQAQPRRAVNPANESEVCIGSVGHPGRHRFRRLTGAAANGLAN